MVVYCGQRGSGWGELAGFAVGGVEEGGERDGGGSAVGVTDCLCLIDCKYGLQADTNHSVLQNDSLLYFITK